MAKECLIQVPTLNSSLEGIMGDGNNNIPFKENEYGVIFIGGKRYYEFDMTSKLPILENTIPFLFKYKNIEIYESSWKMMAVKIVEELDKINPKSKDFLLKLEYWWSKTEVFSSIPRTNFTAFRDIFLNTNHTSTHAMMSIQCLLKAYDVPPSSCYFVIKKHPISEPYSIRIYFKNKNIEGFKNSMVFRGFSRKRIDSTINNFNTINKLLTMVSQGYDDFFLFDDYNYFSNYKIKTIQKANEKLIACPGNIPIVERALTALEEYYKNKKFYDSISKINVNPLLKEQIKDEIEFLLNTLKTSTITISKLYSRMSIMHSDTLKSLGEFNSASNLFNFVTAYFEKEYYCKKPFISKYKNTNLENDDIIIAYVFEQDEFSITKLNNYCSRMHLKKISNYLKFMIDIADDYVQLDQERFMKKETFDITNDQLDKIKHELSYHIKSFGAIDGTAFSGYSALPNIGRSWNKYLLLGVVRTYLSHALKISYSGATYKTFKFRFDLL